MRVLRTPDSFFQELEGYPFLPNYVEVSNDLRMHYVDEGNERGEAVLLLHGEPSWSYLYRKMIPILADAGCRVIAPDLIGFGRSDKPMEMSDYSYQSHVDWLKAFINHIQLKDITLFCQDWGGLLGLRILGEEPQLFKRVVVGNSILPTGDVPANKAFMDWRAFSQNSPKFDIGTVIQRATVTELSPRVIAGYNAPFPDDTYKAGARIFPSLVPVSPDDPASDANRAAWSILRTLDIPFLTTFSDSDPIMKGLEKIFQAMIPGAKGQAHTIIEKAGHFLQEDKGEEIATLVVEFINSNP